MGAYSHWEQSLKDYTAGKRVGGTLDDPQCGFYRRKNTSRQTKEITYDAVAIYRDADGIVGVVLHANGSTAVVMGNSLNEWWNSVCGRPITEDAYRARERGEPWPDAHTAAPKDKSAPVAPPAPANAVPEPTLSDQIEKLASGADQYAKIEDDGTAQRAQSLRANLTELAGKADKERASQKEPHLEAGRKVDAEWMPVVKRAKDVAASIRSSLEAWENEKRRIARVAAEKAERERLEFERQKREAEAKNAPPPPEPVKPIPNTPPPAAQIRGAAGRAAAVSVWHEVIVDDEAAAYAFLRGDPDLTALIKKLAQAKVNAGVTVPGTHTEERTRVR